MKTLYNHYNNNVLKLEEYSVIFSNEINNKVNSLGVRFRRKSELTVASIRRAHGVCPRGQLKPVRAVDVAVNEAPQHVRQLRLKALVLDRTRSAPGRNEAALEDAAQINQHE